MYGRRLAGQYIELPDGFYDGDYCLVSTADPDGKVIEARAAKFVEPVP